MAIKLITPPAVEPVTLAEARLHLRCHDGITADDALIASQIVAAREAIEAEVERSLIATTWELLLDGFPGDGSCPIELPRPPLLSVTSIGYVDTAGDAQVLAAGGYRVSGVGTTGPGWVRPAHGTSWPATLDATEVVTIRFVAGYGAAGAAVRALTKAAILIYLGFLYENREPAAMPDGIRSLLAAEFWGPYP